MTTFPARLERFGSVDSTQRLVAGWLAAGEPEVAVAVADVQTAGRGRDGRTWEAPTGTSLLISCGFRPTWLAPHHAWRLGATLALAMVDAAEDVAGLREATLGLKWPNDLVAERPSSAGTTAGAGALMKLAGVLGETAGTADRIETAVVGIGVNVAWPSDLFPPDLVGTMTSLLELAAGRPVDREALLDEFLGRLEGRYEALRGGRFDAAAWSRRQRTTGRYLAVELGTERMVGRGEGVDPERGALLLETADGRVAVDSGEVIRCAVLPFEPTRASNK